jgi:hypothetical protein
MHLKVLHKFFDVPSTAKQGLQTVTGKTNKENTELYLSLVSAPAFRQFDVKTTAASFIFENGTTGALKYL